MNAIEAVNLKYSYGAQEVLHDISLRIRQGEFVSIIGPNGAGKSTLLRLLCRLLESQSGKITLLGKDIGNLHHLEIARQVGFVAQETHFSLNFTVKDVVRMGRYPHLRPFQRETSEDREAVAQALEYAQVGDLLMRPVNSLSSGERQRVVIARVLAQKPGIVLLDEPTSHLDLHHQHAIMELLQKLNRESLSIAVVQHDLNLASLYAERLVLMHEGRIHADGSPGAIINEKMLTEVYKIPVKVITHPEKKIPQVLFS
jgi:iron complex transport system ATP-binding protein